MKCDNITLWAVSPDAPIVRCDIYSKKDCPARSKISPALLRSYKSEFSKEGRKP
jgi:hypothetical protein